MRAVRFTMRVRHQTSDKTQIDLQLCKCKKSKCIRQYCICFRAGELCQGCDCVDCYNDGEHEEDR